MGHPPGTSGILPASFSGSRTIVDTDDHQLMTASEQMYFLGAPLAHVVQYQEHLRAARRTRLQGRRSAGSDPRTPLSRH